jgi:hypothetical protein
MWKVTGALAAFCSFFLFCFSGELFSVFHSDSAVVSMGVYLAPLSSVAIIFDIFFYVNQGAFRACAHQATSARITALALWFIALPLSLLLSRFFGIAGILVGLTVGVAVGASLGAYWLWRKVDWQGIALETSRAHGELPQEEDQDEGAELPASDHDSELSLTREGRNLHPTSYGTLCLLLDNGMYKASTQGVARNFS